MEEVKVIGIHLATLESLIRGIIKEELSHFEGKVQNLYLQQDPPKQQLAVKDVATLLGITRQTLLTYRKKGYLPEPLYNQAGRPYWTREQIISINLANGLGQKFSL